MTGLTDIKANEWPIQHDQYRQQTQSHYQQLKQHFDQLRHQFEQEKRSLRTAQSPVTAESDQCQPSRKYPSTLVQCAS